MSLQIDDPILICSGPNEVMTVKCPSHEIEYLSNLMEYLKNFISFSHQQEKLSSDKQEMTFNPFLLVGNFRSFNWIHSRTLRPPLSCSLLENLPAGSTYGQAQLILPSQKSSLRTHFVENLETKEYLCIFILIILLTGDLPALLVETVSCGTGLLKHRGDIFVRLSQKFKAKKYRNCWACWPHFYCINK